MKKLVNIWTIFNYFLKNQLFKKSSCDCPGDYDDVDFSYRFMLEGLLPSGCLFNALANTRYTLCGLIDADSDYNTRYEVYFDDLLASGWVRSDEVEDAVGSSRIEINITAHANNLIYYPSVIFRNHNKTSTRNNLRGYVGGDNPELALNREGRVAYLVDSTLRKGFKFKSHIPCDIYNNNTSLHDYGSNFAAFGMVVALYYVAYHRFLEYTSGVQTDDVRNSRTNAEVFAEVIQNEIVHKRKFFNKPTGLDYWLAEAWAEQAIAEGNIGRRRVSKVRILDLLNRWLREKAFLDCVYQIKVDLFIRFPVKFFNENFSIESEYIDKARKGDGVEYTGQAYLVDLNGRKLDISHVGAGYSQVIPILAGLANRTTLHFKQPEVHLHPRLQSRVADCFVEMVFQEKTANESMVRIIETHSEHFVLRLLRRLRESSFDELYHSTLTVYPEDVAFVYFQPQGDSTRVHEIAVLPSGEFIEGWPDGFFDERDEDLWGMPSPRGR